MSAYATPTPLPPAPPTTATAPLHPKPEDLGNLSSSNSADFDDRDAGGGKAPSRVTARRAQQNREAQRNFRERRKNYIKDLEAKVQSLISKDALLQKTEQQCRDFQMIVDRLSAERDVWVRERELWWREREEIYRAVEALRMEVRQSQTENRRLREMAWTLWNDVGGRNAAVVTEEGDVSVVTGDGERATEDDMPTEESKAAEPTDSTKKQATEMATETSHSGPSDEPEFKDASEANVEGEDKSSSTAAEEFSSTNSTLPGAPFGNLGILGDLNAHNPEEAAPTAPMSPTDIAHDLLALSRASSPTIRHAQVATPNAAPESTAGTATNNALEDLKTRMSFWDAERENLYRAASERERELLLSSLIPGASPAAGMNCAMSFSLPQ
ncbi:hypothetical protein DFS34DRAFT_650533 [Phlyctochytrium arcticum]|nr:hypothetical protein DFS34DRAFT_650533 [Phlyctochytrium arcticum]